MDLRDSPEEARFRARLRAWLAENLPAEPEPAALADRWPYMRAFQQRMYQGGWSPCPIRRRWAARAWA